MIKNEDSSSPLNDDVISKRLRNEGINLNRRTVAKYRKTLKILPTYLRKKVKSA